MQRAFLSTSATRIATPFFGQDLLASQKAKGISRKLVGLTLSDRNIARRAEDLAGARFNFDHLALDRRADLAAINLLLGP